MAIKVYSHRPVNLHSKDTPGGLVHVEAKRPHLVPDDVADHPGFQLLQDSGTLKVLKGKQVEPEPVDGDDADDGDDSDDNQ